jgi:polyhydroxyalkanoate synthesis regulator phasin
MAKKLKEAYLASLGIMSLTYDKAQKISNELIKKGELAKEKQQKFIAGLLKEANKNTAEVSKIINEKLEYLAEKGEPVKEKQDKLIKDLQVKAKKTGVVTEGKIKEAVKDVIAKSKAVKEKSQKLVNDLKEKSIVKDEARIAEALKKLDIPTKDELKKINTKLDRLIKNYKQDKKEQSVD